MKRRPKKALFIGIDGLTVSVTTLSVAINDAGGADNGTANTTVLDLQAAPLEVNTGGGDSITLDFDGGRGRLLQVEGTLDLGVFGFFFVSGDFAIEKSDATVTLARSAWDQIVTGTASLPGLIAGGEIDVDGSRLKLIGFFSMLDEFEPAFDIVTP